MNGFPDQSVELPELDLLDSDYNTIPKESKIERLKQIERDAFSLDKRITKVRKAAYYEHECRRQLINSHGLNLSHRDTLFTTSIVVVAEESDDSQVGWDFDFSRFYADLHTETIGSSASNMALSLLGAHSLPSFRGPVVLDSSVGYQLLGVLAQSFLAESAQKNEISPSGENA